jgi:hypothetical protein
MTQFLKTKIVGSGRSSFLTAHASLRPLTVDTRLEITDFGVFEAEKFEQV